MTVSVFRLAQNRGTLALSDWFTPYNWQELSNNDLDLSSAVVLLPTQSGTHPYEAVAVGKEGTIYLLDRNNLGNICTSCLVQEVQSAVPGTGSPVYWNHALYFSSHGGQVHVYRVSQGLLLSPAIKSESLPAGGLPVITPMARRTGSCGIWEARACFGQWTLRV